MSAYTVYKAALATVFSPFLISLLSTQPMTCGGNEWKGQTAHWGLHSLFFSKAIWAL